MRKNYTLSLLFLFLSTSLIWANNCPTNRVNDGLLVLYQFTEGSGTTITDVSGYGSPENLTIEDSDHVTWLSGGGLMVQSSTIIKSAGAATKIIDAVTASNEITMEVWVQPANTTQDGPARIMTISEDTGDRNATLGQDDDKIVARLRTEDVNNNGMPNTETASNMLSTSLLHIVYTRDASGQEYIYLNGVQIDSDTRTGSFSNWDDDYHLALANELTENRTWLGTYYMAAIYDKALSQAEVTTNYNEGTCAENVVSIPSEWQFDCTGGDGQYVETVGMGIKNQVPATLNFSDINSITQVVVEVVYKGGNPGNTIEIHDADGTAYTAYRETPIGGSSNVYMYRTNMPATSSVSYSETSNESKAQSLIAHLFRQVVGVKTQVGKFAYISGYRDLQTLDFTIPTGTQSRAIEVVVPISELTDDCRILYLTANAGNVTKTVTVNGPNAEYGSCCLDIITINLENVAASTTSVELEILSPSGSGCNNGQSYVLIGAVTVDVECPQFALPVELSYFNAALNRAEEVELDWETNSELNNDYFQVERSIDTKNWETIDQIAGAGTTESISFYQTIDPKPMSGTSYYRLKQVDFDGQFEYSEIKSITLENSDVKDISIFPIPASNLLYVQGIEEMTSFTVFNNVGMQLQVPYTLQGAQLKLDVSRLDTGIYFFTVSNGETKISRKFSIQ
ncbi:MAG: LamG-like jellyroll fold domain-containing protein [Bacteroidota bacterium]